MSASPPTHEELSERELEILRLVATGASNKQIAHQLNISANTVKAHLHSIFAKTGAVSRTEATLYALRAGLAQVEGAPVDESAAALPERVVARVNWWRRPEVIALAAIVLAVAAIALINASRWTDVGRPTAAVAAVSPAPIATIPSRWQTRAPMPTARSGLAVAAYANRIYAIGGESAQGITGAVERYDPADNSWITLAPKPNPVTDAGAVVIGGQIFVPGGCDAHSVPTSRLEVYAPREDRWETRAPLPIALCAYALAAFEGKMYVFGGWDGHAFVASVYEYDPERDAWRARAVLPTARGYAGAAVAGGKIFVIGGTDGKQSQRANEEYQPERDEWRARAPLPAGRAGMGIASIAEIIHLVGGEGETKSLPPMQYFHQQDAWQRFENPPGMERWLRLGLVPVETRLYGVGGLVDGAIGEKNLAYQAIYTIVVPGLR